MPGNPGTYKPYQPYWKGWPHFLGNEKNRKTFLGRRIKKKLEKQNYQVQANTQNGKKNHPDMPSNPSKYKPWQKYWKGWPHFLRNEKLPWEEGLKKVRSVNLKQEQYKKWQKNHPDMPSNPSTYKPWQKHWKGWAHFLGTEKLSWEEGLKKVQNAKLSGGRAYQEWKKNHPDMPADPSAYKPWQKYWKGWKHFLGNEKNGLK